MSYIIAADFIVVVVVAKVTESEVSEHDIFQNNALGMVIRRSFIRSFTVPKLPLRKMNCRFKFLAPSQQQHLTLDIAE